MAVIGSYNAAVSIDGANHFLLIQPGNSSTAYNKISRNVLLGITGQPVDVSTAQSITNKTLDNTNILTLRDDRFTLQDDADTTKQAKFQLSGITTGTTRTYTLPNASSTLADIATAQTFTNKTLTSPTITGGTIDNSTITVDSIAGHTSATIVTVGGVQMNNGIIATANAVTTTSIADSAVTPAKLLTGTGSGWSWQSFTPAFTNFTIGNGVIATRYTQIGKSILWQGRVTLGSTSAMSAAPTMTLPVTMNTTVVGSGSNLGPLGTLYLVNTGVQLFLGIVQTLNSTTASLLGLSSSAGIPQTNITSTTPFTWVNGSIFSWSVIYEAA